MRDFLASIRLEPNRFWPHRVLRKLAALRRAGLAVPTGAGSERMNGRQIVPNLDPNRRSRCQPGRNHRPLGANRAPPKLENAGLRLSHTRQAWQATSAAGCR